MAINGAMIIVKRDGLAIAGSRSHEIQVDSDTIEISSQEGGGWRHFVAGRRSWSLTVNYLVVNNGGTRDVLSTGFESEIVIGDRDDRNKIGGKAILKTCKQTCTIGNLVQGTFQFVGTGELKPL